VTRFWAVVESSLGDQLWGQRERRRRRVSEACISTISLVNGPESINHFSAENNEFTEQMRTELLPKSGASSCYRVHRIAGTFLVGSGHLKEKPGRFLGQGFLRYQ